MHPRYEKEYSPEDAKKDLTVNYTQTAMKIAKLYAPAVILGSASLGCLLASNDILRKRNAALSAAYMTVDKSFKEYRSRVAERFGEEVEKEIRYNIKAMEVENVVALFCHFWNDLARHPLHNIPLLSQPIQMQISQEKC